jgi:hypothetical protein
MEEKKEVKEGSYGKEGRKAIMEGKKIGIYGRKLWEGRNSGMEGE